MRMHGRPHPQLLAWIVSGSITLLLGPGTAHADECLEDGQPIANLPLHAAQALESPGASFDVLDDGPFATLTTDELSIREPNCTPDCLVSSAFGETRCGNLAQDPIGHTDAVELVNVPVPDAFAELAGALEPSGKWSFYGQAFVSADLDPPGPDPTRSTMRVRLGTREVFDVASSTPGPQTVRIRLLVSSHLDFTECQGTLLRTIPSHSLRLFVQERTAGATLLSQGYDQFFARDETFEIQVEPGAVLQVDLLLRIAAAAVSGPHFDPFNPAAFCYGGLSIPDFAPGLGTGPPGSDETDGMQLFVSASPTMTLTPRSGLVYEPVPVPEPPAGATAAGAALLLLARRRRPRG